MKKHFLIYLAAGVSLFIAADAFAKDCELKKKAELPLGYSSGFITVSAKINGISVTLGIDTGASTLITPEAAADLNLPRDWRRTLARGTTSAFIASHVLLRELEFGGDRFTWQSVAKIALPEQKSPNSAIKQSPIAGLIGMDVLADYDFDFDFPHRKLSLYVPARCWEGAPPGYPFVNRVAFRFTRQRNMILTAIVDGARLNLVLDTGSTLHMLTRSAIRRAGVTGEVLRNDPQFDATGAGNVTLKHTLHRFKRLSVGLADVPDVSIGVLNRDLVEGDGLLGQPFLTSRRFWVSTSTKAVYFEQAPYSLDPPPLPSTLLPGTASGGANAATMADACAKYPVLRQFGQCQAPVLLPSTSNALPALGAKPPEGQHASEHSPAPDLLKRYRWPGETGSYFKLPGRAEPDGFLGVGLTGLSLACRLAAGAPAENGLIVSSFTPISPAEKAGLKIGDLVIALNEEPVANAASVLVYIARVRQGQMVRFTVIRRKEEKIIEAEVAGQTFQPPETLDPDGFAVRQIEAAEAVLDVLPAEKCAQERAIFQASLGGGYIGRKLEAGLAGFQERAIETLEQALAVLDRQKYKRAWAVAQINLGHAYSRGTFGELNENIEKAIEAYEAAVAYSEGLGRVERARASMGLGFAHLRRGSGSRTENLERSIAAFQTAKGELDPKFDRADWGELHRRLAAAYVDRMEGPHEQNIEAAIAALESALAAYAAPAFSKEREAVFIRLAELKAQRAPMPPVH